MTSDIRTWLDGLGLGQYAETFEANAIDLDTLPHISDDDLAGLGVALGHRRKLQAALAAMAESQAPADAPSREAERRQLTVMFCDLVGSTALSEQLDPEDLRDVMAAYRRAAGAVVTRFDGHVAQYLGDGVMAYFGWPRAHEDDGERAVRAGLEIVDAVKAVDAPSPLKVRVGIATGPVVVGEGADDDAEANKLAVGETPNLAARLQGLAGPDQIVIGPGTHQLVGGAFETDELGPRNLKGIDEPVPAWRVKGASAAEGRFEARAAGGLTPFVGREAELQMLLDRWRQAKDGEGQVVLLEGEPGIGKSRITQVLRDRLADDRHVRLRYQCSPYYVNSAFYPIIDQLERAAGFGREDTPDQKLDKLEAALAQSADDVARVAPLIAAILSLPLDRYPPLNLSPQRQKDDTIDTFAAQIAGLAKKQPVLLIFEDAHWCDPTTLETLTAVIGGIEAAPVLIVITYRPEFEPPWTGYGHVVTQSLSRLGKRQGGEMVARVTGGKVLPDEVRDQIVAKTDGVPLFVEELTKTVLEAGFLRDAGDRYELAGEFDQVAIPATLQDSLMARLDRDSAVKEIAQIGACIGRDFAYDLLAAVYPKSTTELGDALVRLEQSELVHRRGAPPEATYTFKHALVQDTAYESLLKTRRQELHATLAETIEREFSHIVDTEPERIAAHFAAAGRAAESVDYWLMAGQAALANFTNLEAVGHLQNGLAELKSCESNAERHEKELTLQTMLGTASIFSKGLGAPETRLAYDRANELCDIVGGDNAAVKPLFGLSLYYLGQGKFHDVESAARRALTKAEATGNENDIYAAQVALGNNAYVYMGRFSEAADYVTPACDWYDPDTHAPLAKLYGWDIGSLAFVGRAVCNFFGGYPSLAVQQLKHALDMAHRANDPASIMMLKGWSSFLYGMLGDGERSLNFAQQVRDMATEQAFLDWIYLASSLEGVATRHSDQPLVALEKILESERFWAQIGGNVVGWHFLGGDALLSAGKAEDALNFIDERLDRIRGGGEGFMTPTALLIKSKALQELGKDEAAEACFHASLDLARNHADRWTELRAATSLAQLWQSQRKTRQAFDLLFPIYDWFTEGFDTVDLKGAKALLDKLGATK